MATVADWFLEVDGERFEASWPEAGDVTAPGRHEDRVSLGLSLAEADDLKRLSGKVGHLLDSRGREVASLQLEKADPLLNVVTATLRDTRGHARAGA